MNERIKGLRKALGLNQTEFGIRIGVKQSTIANYEKGIFTPPDRTIADICREFGVSKAWLLDGDGDMFVTRSRNEEIALVVNSIMSESDDSFRKRFLACVCELSPDQWELLHDFIKKLAQDS